MSIIHFAPVDWTVCGLFILDYGVVISTRQDQATCPKCRHSR